jgi:hypothetical protein
VLVGLVAGGELADTLFADLSAMRIHIHHLILLPFLAVMLPGFVSTADAQIYTWRDDSGHMVLSNHPHGS